EQPDGPVARGATGPDPAGLDDAEHVDAERRLHHPALDSGQGRRGRAVARHDEQLHAPLDELLGDLEAEALELLRVAPAVREARRVAEVDEVLVRQRDEQLVQDGQPADAGVEDADGAAAGDGGHGSACWQGAWRSRAWRA